MSATNNRWPALTPRNRNNASVPRRAWAAPGGGGVEGGASGALSVARASDGGAGASGGGGAGGGGTCTFVLTKMGMSTRTFNARYLAAFNTSYAPMIGTCLSRALGP